MACLVTLTEPISDRDDVLPGWWTDTGPGGASSIDFPGGHANHGMAHGIGGVLALLALAMRHGVTVDGQAAAMERVCAWLDRWRQDDDRGPWWPYWITRAELRAGRVLRNGGPRRPSWCYGTLGLARAQQLAGLALRDRERQELAETAAARALGDAEQLGQTGDASLCHGHAGLIHITRLMAADSSVPGTLTGLLPDLLSALTLELEKPGRAPPGWLEGRAGTALALNALATRVATDWDRALLIA